MISIAQAEVIGAVLKRFNENESLSWTRVDEYMCHLTWLTDKEVVDETELMLTNHRSSNARCEKDHPTSECFVPVVLDAVSYIIDDFKTSHRLAKKARYVVEYYISLSQTGTIISD